MADKERLAELRELVERAAELANSDAELTFRAMFGGIGGYADGRVFACIWQDGIGLKLSDEHQEALLDVDGAKRLQFDSSMPPSKHYIMVPEALLPNTSLLGDWVAKSIAYVQTLPLPAKRNGSRGNKSRG